MTVQKIVLSPTAGSYLGSMEKEYARLDSIRKEANLPVLKKAYSFGNVTAIIICSDYGKIVLYGGLPEIYLLSSDRYGLVTYSNESISVGSHSHETHKLFQLYGNKLIAGGKIADISSGTPVYTDADGHWKTVTDFARQLSYQLEGATLKAYYNGAWHNQGQLYPELSYIPELSVVDVDFFGAIGFEHAPPWNIYRGVEKYFYNPSNGKGFKGGRWVPSISYMEPANTLMQAPGLYYAIGNNLKGGGKNMSSESPASYIAVTFLGYSTSRSYAPRIYKRGYCELLTKIDDMDAAWLNIFIFTGYNGMPNSTEFNRISFYQYYAATYLRAKKSASNINLEKYFTLPVVDPKADMWDTVSPSDGSETSITGDIFGCIVYDQANAVVIYNNATISSAGFPSTYTTTIYDTKKYVDHSVSSDGRYVAIFEGGAVIESIRVFDLAFRTGLTGDEFREAPPFKQISFYAKINGIDASLGEFIPRKWPNKYLRPLFSDGVGAMPQVTQYEEFSTDFESSLGGVFWDDHEKGKPIWVWKISCEDGVHAEARHIAADECLSMGVTVVESGDDGPAAPSTISIGEYSFSGGSLSQIASSLPFGIASGNKDPIHTLAILGKWSGAGSGIKVSPIDVSGTNIKVTKGEELRDLDIVHYVSGTFEVKNGKGEVTCGDCLNEDCVTVNHDCVKEHRCSGKVPYSAVSSCGQTGKRIEDDPYDELGINTDSNYYTVGATYWGTGGGGDYKWMTAARFDDFGSHIVLTDTSGLCGMQPITVVDRCGVSFTREFRSSVGQWVVVEKTENANEDYWSYHNVAYTVCRVVSDRTITHTYYQPRMGRASTMYKARGVGDCVPNPYSWSCGGQFGCGLEICGEACPLAPLSSIPNYYRTELGMYASGCTIFFVDSHTGSYPVGWYCWTPVSGTKIWEWQCP